ncbi:ferritin-like domain-containing protein [Kordiimonas sp. SCSIO 12610]|uniref:ferritin-like domain-containing protein n=1 Tax=Kordiimonas sp. SCSIO 12610 TaxID=2829597 RepID=UPI00210B730A|nr:ferritin-like domain-containing protein [Kordiimonas sp. SCSIO 12610]UTW53851.1 ferritin-like domain-containing protein [Kordiimonas sp. SCSIO 12610]
MSVSSKVNFTDISTASLAVLETPDAIQKVETARMVARKWQAGELPFQFSAQPNLRPQRPEKPELLDPNQMPRRRKAGNIENRKALLHAVAHIELNAIDLAFDIVARFGKQMPRDFTDDWIQVGDDEARHFSMLGDRLNALDCKYGDLPAHDGLWQSAEVTRHDISARLAIVPMVLEARGLDVTPAMIDRFERFGDSESAKTLKIIYEEEVSHVAAGTKWFSYLAEKAGHNTEDCFQSLVKQYFKGQLKRPFNHPARLEAGMVPSFYEPLADMLNAL